MLKLLVKVSRVGCRDRNYHRWATMPRVWLEFLGHSVLPLSYRCTSSLDHSLKPLNVQNVEDEEERSKRRRRRNEMSPTN